MTCGLGVEMCWLGPLKKHVQAGGAIPVSGGWLQSTKFFRTENVDVVSQS